jgi:hypothetical protein
MKTLRALASLVAVTSLSLLAGCVVEVVELQSPGSAAAQAGAGIAKGKPTRLTANAPEAYWIWEDGNGTWHLRTTTAKKQHRFQGSVRTQQPSAQVTGFKAVGTETNDRIRTQNDRVFFDFTTQGHEDGIDFTVSQNSCLTFNLEIDGQDHPKLIIIGKDNVSPAAGYFSLCP